MSIAIDWIKRRGWKRVYFVVAVAFGLVTLGWWVLEFRYG